MYGDFCFKDYYYIFLRYFFFNCLYVLNHPYPIPSRCVCILSVTSDIRHTDVTIMKLTTLLSKKEKCTPFIQYTFNSKCFSSGPFNFSFLEIILLTTKQKFSYPLVDLTRSQEISLTKYETNPSKTDGVSHPRGSKNHNSIDEKSLLSHTYSPTHSVLINATKDYRINKINAINCAWHSYLLESLQQRNFTNRRTKRIG